MDVSRCRRRPEPAGWTCPGVAAVPAHPDAVDLDSGPDKLVIQGIYHQSSDSRRGDISALCRKIRREILPVLTAVPRAKERRRRRPDKHSTRFHRVDGNAQAFVAIQWRIDMLDVST